MNNAVANPEPGMELRDLLLDPEFPRRKKRRREPVSEGDALRHLARVFADSPELILQSLVDLVVETCGADSSGISLEEKSETGEPRFRWAAVAGSFEAFLNGTTPRFFSPCGKCLDTGRAQLYRVTKPYYDYLGITAEPITDGLLIPWVNEEMRGTLWAVAHEREEAFDLIDYKLLNSLADFASMAVRHGFQEKILKTAAKRRSLEGESQRVGASDQQSFAEPDQCDLSRTAGRPGGASVSAEGLCGTDDAGGAGEEVACVRQAGLGKRPAITVVFNLPFVSGGLSVRALGI